MNAPGRSTSATRGLDAAAAHARARECAVLDVRDPITFEAGHPRGAGNIPRAELAVRRSELPPRDRRVLVVASDGGTAADAAAEIAALDYAEVCWLDAPVSALEGGLESRGPAARLWRAAPFLEEVLPLLAPGRAADVAAGAGREAVFLAMNGFRVEAWDMDEEALRRADALAARHGVAIETVRADLEGPDGSPGTASRGPELGASSYDLIVCFRFLHRPLLPRMAHALAPGGMLVYETYRVGQERFGKPRRARFLLESGELARAFADLEILRYEEPTPPGGPLTARLLARKRA